MTQVLIVCILSFYESFEILYGRVVMNCYELFRIVQFSHVFTDVLHSMCNVLLRRVKPQCPEPAAKVAMGNVSCHPREKPSDDAELVVQKVQNDNPMHFRRLQRSHFSWNHLEHVSCPPFFGV